jgi:hypothetical protein
MGVAKPITNAAVAMTATIKIDARSCLHADS